MTENELLTVHEVAGQIGQSEQTVRRKIRAGELAAVRLGRGPRAPLRVPADYLRTWLYTELDE
jgi:excisionase family DNA binding protein